MLKKNLLIIAIVLLLCLTGYYFLMRKNPLGNQSLIPAYIEQATSGVWQPYKPENAINVAEYPASTDLSHPEEFLQNVVVKYALGPPANTIIGQTPKTIQGHSAIDFNLQSLEGATLGRAILAGNTLYMLTVKNRDLNDLENSFNSFVTAFKIT
jgi:hypothetical protein